MGAPDSTLFSIDDLEELCEQVTTTWLGAADRDWSVRAGTLRWSCLATADHAVDCVYAPAFFLASRQIDRYPDAGRDLTLGDRATPQRLVESLQLATRMLRAAVRDADPADRAILFRKPEPMIGSPCDFAPRAAIELALHAHDVAVGLEIPFEVADALARRLREHTRSWPMWAGPWGALGSSGEPWDDLLGASGRSRIVP